jgi:septation ring formation regulator EzrA
LEERVAELSSSLENAQVDLESKSTLADQLGNEKCSLEKQLDETKKALQDFESREQNGDSALMLLKEEVSCFNLTHYRHLITIFFS